MADEQTGLQFKQIHFRFSNFVQKYQEHQQDMYHALIDFKKAYDTIHKPWKGHPR